MGSVGPRYYWRYLRDGLMHGSGGFMTFCDIYDSNGLRSPKRNEQVTCIACLAAMVTKK